jgi:hypothetical protein
MFRGMRGRTKAFQTRNCADMDRTGPYSRQVAGRLVAEPACGVGVACMVAGGPTRCLQKVCFRMQAQYACLCSKNTSNQYDIFEFAILIESLFLSGFI